ncbi:hypothetical protein FA13DRAFT_1651748, partial [Coprinellus micaceus]
MALRTIRILSFNIAKSWDQLVVLLESQCKSFDIVFLQEPPWRLIRHAPSATNKEGTEVRGSPRHPKWTCMVPPVQADEHPRVMAYVSRRLDALRPTFRRDLVDDRDVMVLSLFAGNEAMHLMNVYSDNQHRGINLIAARADSLPGLDYMAGDFNCHGPQEWDEGVPNHPGAAVTLLETAARLGVEYSAPVNPGPTYVSRADENIRSVIDLVFVPPADSLAAAPLRDQLLKGGSDHFPLSNVLPLRQNVEKITGRTLKEDAEVPFFQQIEQGIPPLRGQFQLGTPEGVEALSEAIANVFSDAWMAHSEEYIITPRSKKWWTGECQTAYDAWKADDSAETRANFRRTVKTTRRDFFDERIKEIAETNKRPWDLMDWVKERKNPPCEAIHYNGEPCHDLDKLWDALHGTYNAANDRPV